MEDLLLQWMMGKDVRGSRPRQVVCTSIHKDLCMELRYGIVNVLNGLLDEFIYYEMKYYEMTL